MTQLSNYDDPSYISDHSTVKALPKHLADFLTHSDKSQPAPILPHIYYDRRSNDTTLFLRYGAEVPRPPNSNTTHLFGCLTGPAVKMLSDALLVELQSLNPEEGRENYNRVVDFANGPNVDEDKKLALSDRTMERLRLKYCSMLAMLSEYELTGESQAGGGCCGAYFPWALLEAPMEDKLPPGRYDQYPANPFSRLGWTMAYPSEGKAGPSVKVFLTRSPGSAPSMRCVFHLSSLIERNSEHSQFNHTNTTGIGTGPTTTERGLINLDTAYSIAQSLQEYSDNVVQNTLRTHDANSDFLDNTERARRTTLSLLADGANHALALRVPPVYRFPTPPWRLSEAQWTHSTTHNAEVSGDADGDVTILDGSQFCLGSSNVDVRVVFRPKIDGGDRTEAARSARELVMPRAGETLFGFHGPWTG